MKNVNVIFRVDENLKAQVDALFADLGLSLSTAFNIFLSERIKNISNRRQGSRCLQEFLTAVAHHHF